jgi:predicted TIM-barrel fold metal-dependent hydrolase
MTMVDKQLTRRQALLLSGAAALSLRASAVRAAPPIPRTSVDFDMPPGACDCHVHIIGDPALFPMANGRVYTPPQASLDDLLTLHAALHLQRVVLVQPSFYGTDNSAMLSALIGHGRHARGVAVVDETLTPDALDRMRAAGVAGLRINLETAGQTDPDAGRKRLQAAIALSKPRGWHIQLYTRPSVIAGMAADLAASPVPLVFDHFGGAQAGQGLAQSGFDAVLLLVRSGKAYVKISAPYRVTAEPAPYADVAPFAQALLAANPDRVLWGSDWPHTDASKVPGRAPTDIAPFYPIDDGLVLNQLPRWVPDAALRRKILVDNPGRLYGF